MAPAESPCTAQGLSSTSTARSRSTPASSGPSGSTRVCGQYDMMQTRMGVLVQIRDVPEQVHRTLKARAASSGTSLSEYVRELLARASARPTPEELAARVEARGKVQLAEPSERSVRRLRDRGE